MTLQIKIPLLGESVSEAVIAKWNKKEGDLVKIDEVLIELETDKVTLEVPSPGNGVLSKIFFEEGGTVKVGDVAGEVDENAGSAVGSNQVKEKDNNATSSVKSAATKAQEGEVIMSLSAQKMATENNIKFTSGEGSGKDGRVMKNDVIDKITSFGANSSSDLVANNVASGANNKLREERVKMTSLRRKIAQRLKDSQNTAAILTTFNEVDMSAVIRMRNQYKDLFEKKHGVKLGFMSIFAKAVVRALKDVPAVNAEIEDNSYIIYKNYYDIGIAVGTEQGLVVPVLRDVDLMSIADIERSIVDYAKKARAGKLKMEELSGATFTITNGGVYGSLLSTPIINPPQSGILGMHKTQDRVVVIDGKMEIRPMMYIALSYDHRIVDGKEAVTFLVKVKEALEDINRLMLDI